MKTDTRENVLCHSIHMKFETQLSKRFTACGCVLRQYTTDKHKKVITIRVKIVVFGGKKVVSRGQYRSLGVLGCSSF